MDIPYTFSLKQLLLLLSTGGDYLFDLIVSFPVIHAKV